MSVERPTEENIKKRSMEIVEETMPYPEDTRGRLLSIKRAAIQELIDKFNENMEVIASHYPGYSIEDIEKLLSFLPKGKDTNNWSL